MGLNKKALFKFLCSVVLLGLNGIMASHIALNNYEIVFLRNLIGLVLLAAIFFAALLLGEKMTVLQIIGAVCIIGGAMIAQRTKELPQ